MPAKAGIQDKERIRDLDSGRIDSYRAFAGMTAQKKRQTEILFMAFEVKLSSLGVSITEGTITRWLKKEGDRVEKGEILAEVETEKVNFEIVAPESGVLLKIISGDKTVAKAESTVALVGGEGEDISGYLQQAGKTKGDAPDKMGARRTGPKIQDGKVRAFPAARFLAKERGVDLNKVEGTGPGGQITKEDVEKFLSGDGGGGDGRIPELEEILPLVGIRKSIADGMSLSVRTAAHVTTVAEVDMTELANLRAEIAPPWKAEGVNLTYVPFVIRAAVGGIAKFPIINSQVVNNEIVIKKYVNFG
ncbi:MAG TPA: 2-oxo acid dehydrogenase subunit E2, partial [Thermodesulfobacteriota bacterium]|nr:2-oxo acid dehydrogenase subunit E2 [Thermodesulfobacteriota bacterium]